MSLKTSSLALVILLSAATLHAQNYRNTVYVAASYTYYKVGDGKVEDKTLRQPVLLITTEYFVPVADILSHTAFAVRDRDESTLVSDFSVLQARNIIRVDASNPQYANYWVLRGNFKPESTYEVTIMHEKVGAWGEDANSHPVPVTPAPKNATVLSTPLPSGKAINNRHVAVDSSNADVSGSTSSGGLTAFWERASLSITPEVADEGDGLGLKYRFQLRIDDKHYTDPLPSTLNFGFNVDGRYTTDDPGVGLSGYSEGNLDFRLLTLFERESRNRYYPAGLRAAVGYESQEDFADARATASAQIVLTVPYVDDLLLAWHELLGVNRPFAPPFVSGGYVYSDNSNPLDSRLSRWEVEAAWQLPIATRWDIDARYRYFDYQDSSRGQEDLWEVNFIFYPGDDHSHGVTIGYEDGFRPVLGDIGSSLFVGYVLRGF